VAVRRLPVLRVAGRGRVDVHGQHPEPMRHIAGPVPGRHPAGAISEPNDQFPCQGAGGDRVGAELRHMPAAVGRLAGHPHTGRGVHGADPERAVPERYRQPAAAPGRAATVVPVDMRAAQQQVVRRVLGVGFVLHTDVRHAVLLLAHLQGGRAHHPGHQPGISDDAQSPDVRQPVRRAETHVANSSRPRFVTQALGQRVSVIRCHHRGQRPGRWVPGRKPAPEQSAAVGPAQQPRADQDQRQLPELGLHKRSGCRRGRGHRYHGQHLGRRQRKLTARDA